MYRDDRSGSGRATCVIGVLLTIPKQVKREKESQIHQPRVLKSQGLCLVFDPIPKILLLKDSDYTIHISQHYLTLRLGRS